MKTIPMTSMSSKPKVLVGLSGGVDSAASVLLLQKEGYIIEGVYLHLQEEDENLSRAEEMAGYLHIPLHILDLRTYFEEEIIRYFIESYQKGETPNPCVRCNERVKFGKMLDFALEKGFDFIATGHYARVIHDEDSSKIFKAKNIEKDQSYVLYTLSFHQRRHILLPLGEIVSKEETRQLLQENKIPFHDREESQEICFVESDYREFLKKRGFIPKTGNFVDEEGNILGEHRGIGFYTHGQRRGLGISAPEPLFVKEVQSDTKQIVLSGASSLMSSVVYAQQIHFFDEIPQDQIEGKIRYSAKPVSCTLYPEGEDTLRIEFEQPVRAATPGQSVVFYRGEELLGGGIIR